MARTRPTGGILGSILTGAQTVVSQLAQYFRLGQFGAVAPPETAQQARPQLTTPEEIVAAAAARHIAPQAGTAARESENYICIYTDRDTGEVLARIREPVEYDVGTARSTRYSRARRAASGRLAQYLPGEDLSLRNIDVTCRFVQGSRFPIS